PSTQSDIPPSAVTPEKLLVSSRISTEGWPVGWTAGIGAFRAGIRAGNSSMARRPGGPSILATARTFSARVDGSLFLRMADTKRRDNLMAERSSSNSGFLSAELDLSPFGFPRLPVCLHVIVVREDDFRERSTRIIVRQRFHDSALRCLVGLQTMRIHREFRQAHRNLRVEQMVEEHLRGIPVLRAHTDTDAVNES